MRDPVLDFSLVQVRRSELTENFANKKGPDENISALFLIQIHKSQVRESLGHFL